MGGEDNRRRFGMALDEAPARGGGHGRIPAEAAVPVRVPALHRMVQQVAGEDGLATAGLEPQADMARRMARPGFDRQPVVRSVWPSATMTACPAATTGSTLSS